jgi:hypothetical protein
VLPAKHHNGINLSFDKHHDLLYLPRLTVHSFFIAMSDSLRPSHELEDSKDETQSENVAKVVEEYPSALNLGFMIVALVLAMFLASLDFTIVGTAIPKITEEFQALDSVSLSTSHSTYEPLALTACSDRMVRFSPVSYRCSLPVAMGQRLQVF